MSLFTCFPSFVSQSGWWRPALQTPLAICFPGCPSLLLVSLHVSPSVPAAVRLSGCLSLLVSLHSSPRSGWWCPSFWMSLFTCLSLFAIMPSAARLSGCLSVLVPRHLDPSLAGGVWLSGCVFTCLILSPFFWLPVWLVVSGSLDVSLYLSPFFSLPLCSVVSGSPDVFSLLSLVSHNLF